MKKILILAVILLLPASNSFAATDPNDQVLATVNGITISEPEVRHYMNKLARPVPEARALQEMINVELLSQQAKKEGLLKDPDLQLEIKRTTNGLIASQYLQNMLKNLKFTKEILQQRYNKEYLDGATALEYNANHILVKSEQAARDIIKQLDAGANFEELAKKLSTGPSGKNGGALGWFKSGDMVSAFSRAAQALKPGEYSKTPVKTRFGWHIIRLNKTRPIPPPAFKDVEKKLANKIATEKINALMNHLRDAANIVINKDKLR